ncbi:MAG TPA: glycosyltransferase, partial [Nitriliruptoraceae bacterium]|nr:glycosyltransferase [Nitriliruptoraceae bacterium]
LQHLADRASGAPGLTDRARELRREWDARHGNWRSLHPTLHDLELTFGPILDELEPDLIHAHDMHMIGVGVRAGLRARLRGRDTKVVYDAHEYVRGLTRHMPDFLLAAFIGLQDEYINDADAVITVSEPLADRLQHDHDLRERPTVILNAPLVDDEDGEEEPDRSVVGIRERIGLPDDDILLVYSGRMHESRDVGTLVEAVGLLDKNVHLALVASGNEAYVSELVRSAQEFGYSDRLHVVDYVAPDEVVDHLRSASIGVNLLIDCVNHEVALPNKFFEYLHAGLPLLNSDVGASAALVRERQLGFTFTPEDPQSLADAASRLIDELDAHRKRVGEDPEFLRQMSWAAQEDALVALYARLLDKSLAWVDDEPVSALTERKRSVAAESRRLVIGTKNMAGQATAWANALMHADEDVHAESHTVARRRETLVFDTTLKVSRLEWSDRHWQLQQLSYLEESFTHALFEGGTTLAGGLNGNNFVGDARRLQAAGLELGLVFHGSDIRNPSKHAELEQFSPFHVETEMGRVLQNNVDNLAPWTDVMDLPTFVSTLGLHDFVEGAQWLPVVVDPQVWQAPALSPKPGRRPVVAHLSTNDYLKGSDIVLDVCRRLEQRGLIDLVEPGLVPPHELPALMRTVDVYIDGILLGDYGVTAVQAMAMNRIVLGNVGSRVRDRLPGPVPIVQITPPTLEDVLTNVAENFEAFTDDATSGRDYVRAHHDGTRSSEVLLSWLDETPGAV